MKSLFIVSVITAAAGCAAVATDLEDWQAPARWKGVEAPMINGRPCLFPLGHRVDGNWMRSNLFEMDVMKRKLMDVKLTLP